MEEMESEIWYTSCKKMKEGEGEWGGKGRRRGGKRKGREGGEEEREREEKEEEKGKKRRKRKKGRVHGQFIKRDEIASGKQFYGLHGNCLPLLLYFILS